MRLRDQILFLIILLSFGITFFPCHAQEKTVASSTQAIASANFDFGLRLLSCLAGKSP